MFSIAIDGPAGAGKSTVAKALAKDLGFIYVDTGALYRAIAFFMIQNKIDLNNINSLVDNLKFIDINLEFRNSEQRVILNGNDVSDNIRTPEISIIASDVSAIKEVREFLLSLQRNFAKKYKVVMDGRDIGTVVLPNADVKVFLTASLEERAKRRYKELKEKGINITLESVLNDMKKRDYNDSNREIAPLKTAEDSFLIDSTDFSIDETVDSIKNIVEEKYINERR